LILVDQFITCDGFVLTPAIVFPSTLIEQFGVTPTDNEKQEDIFLPLVLDMLNL